MKHKSAFIPFWVFSPDSRAFFSGIAALICCKGVPSSRGSYDFNHDGIQPYGPDTECFNISFALNGVNIIWNGINSDVRNASTNMYILRNNSVYTYLYSSILHVQFFTLYYFHII